VTATLDLARAIAVLERTPAALAGLLSGLDETWTHANEGPGTWSPFDVVGHLIHGERTDWIPRLRIVLELGESRPFDPFDRFAQLEANRGKSIGDLLDEFAGLRAASLDALRSLRLSSAHLARTGTHPALGRVTASELLATWVVHDLNHLSQIARAMAHTLRDDVGPWREYLPILVPRA
jgi:hypothetical protein